VPPLVEEIEAFTDPQNEAQLQMLDATLQGINTSSCGKAEIGALLGVFERFPEADGFGVFWGILHALEALEGYEPQLLASVQRKPCEFNVLMAGLLRSVLSNPQATAQALHDAQQYLARREAGEA
jgi:hypothetical protein